MSRRVRVPAADELFRATQPLQAVDEEAGEGSSGRERLRAVPDIAGHGAADPGGPQGTGPQRRPGGRERHREKITVYVTPEELLELEQARLALRGQYGLAVDRGRLVREAVAAVLAEFDTLGEGSTLVRRLRRA